MKGGNISGSRRHPKTKKYHPLYANQARAFSSLVGEGQGTADAENAGRITISGNGLEVQGDTGGDVRGDGDALGDRGGSDGNGAGVGTSDQSGAQVKSLIVDVDSPYLLKVQNERLGEECVGDDRRFNFDRSMQELRRQEKREVI